MSATISVVRRILTTRFKEWVDANHPEIPIAYEDVPFKKPSNNDTYFEVILVAGDPVHRSVDAKSQTHFGSFSINVAVLEGTGTTGISFAEAIADLYKVGSRVLAPVFITNPPSIKSRISDNAGRKIYPIVIRYRAEI
jgi:hypothetical protein